MVAEAILKRQQHFLEFGPMAMKPLGLREIADELGLHESTVSRVTNNKYMATPVGVFELKYFFSREMATASGGACSATAIRGVIKGMIDAENPADPLSDAQIARLLVRQGLKVARRTVTKYRQLLKVAVGRAATPDRRARPGAAKRPPDAFRPAHGMPIASKPAEVARRRRNGEPRLAVAGESQSSPTADPEVGASGCAEHEQRLHAPARSGAGPDLERRSDRSNDWFSPSWATYTGRSSDELLGDGWMRARPSRRPRPLRRHPRHELRGARAVLDGPAPAPPRRRVPLDARQRRAARVGADGAAIGYVGSCVDIHERKELEESLAERTQQLRLAERRQGQFLAMLSHELRNPLAPIANAASVLRTLEHTNPILVRLREILERQVGRLGHLVEELIDVTRAAQGQISLVREQVSVESIVQAAVAHSHDKLNAGGHRLEVDVPDERLFVRGDRGRLAQALVAT